MKLEKKDTLYYIYNNPTNITKIAGFDLDYTLIKTKSGNKFPKDENDWTWLYDNVPTILEKLVKDNFSIVVFTNQKGVSKGTESIDRLFIKFKQIAKQLELLKISLDFLVATDDDWYRKPMTGMWKTYLETHTIEDLKNSFYCGDAAGRIYSDKKLNDHSDADINFANNIDLTFKLPEEVFNQKIIKFKMNNKYEKIRLTDYISEEKDRFTENNNEMVVLVGPPAIGKSTFAKLHYSKYIYINKDTDKTDTKCLAKTKKALNEGKSIIIDNTNPSMKAREKYLSLAKEYGYNIKVYIFEQDKNYINHMNHYRTQKSQGKTKLIPDIAYRMFNSKYEEPNDDELKKYNTKYEIIKYKSRVYEDMLNYEYFYHY